MVRVTAVNMAPGGTLHEHIANVQWVNPSNGQVGASTRTAMIDFMQHGGKVIVSDGVRAINVEIVQTPTVYIRTRADGVWTDNLLALPRY